MSFELLQYLPKATNFPEFEEIDPKKYPSKSMGCPSYPLTLKLINNTILL